MAVRFVIPAYLRTFTSGRSEFELEASGDLRDVGAALDALWAAHPGVRDRVLTETGEVRPHVNVFVDGESIRYTGGLATPVRANAEIAIVPAVSGGSIMKTFSS